MNIAEILSKHVKEDGTIDIEAATKELNEALPLSHVPKHEFNAKNDQLKDANSTIAKLQKDNKDNESLQNDVKAQKERADQTEAELKKVKLQRDAEDLLRDKGVTNLKFALYEMGELERADDGKIKDFDSKFKSFSEANPAFVKTKEETDEPNPAGTFKGVNPANPDGSKVPANVSWGAKIGQLVAQQNQPKGDK